MVDLRDHDRKICRRRRRPLDRIFDQVPVGPLLCVHGTATMTELAGWGRYPRCDTRVLSLRERTAVLQAITAHEGLIARGNGRSYGDSSIGRVTTFDLRHLDRFIDFDSSTGVLKCEAGVLLSDVIDTFA